MAFDLDEFLRAARQGRYSQAAPATLPELHSELRAEGLLTPLVPAMSTPMVAAVAILTLADAPRLFADLEHAVVALCGVQGSVVAPGLDRVRELIRAALGMNGSSELDPSAAYAALPAALDDVEDLLEACALSAH